VLGSALWKFTKSWSDQYCRGRINIIDGRSSWSPEVVANEQAVLAPSERKTEGMRHLGTRLEERMTSRNSEPATRSNSPEGTAPGEYVGSWYTWWPGDRVPRLTPIPGFVAVPSDDDREVARLGQLDPAEVVTFRQNGNQPYVARIDGESAACGWSAGSRLEIGEIGVAASLPAGERYLWGFMTEERWRGRGIYPHLLRAIIRHEQAERSRYWIGHTPGNRSSARGMRKAGFGVVGDVYRLPEGEGRLVMVPVGPIERARASAGILGIELLGHGGD
jgi:GNAT superfamily N-acetyltransferase